MMIFQYNQPLISLKHRFFPLLFYPISELRHHHVESIIYKNQITLINETSETYLGVNEHFKALLEATNVFKKTETLLSLQSKKYIEDSHYLGYSLFT